MMADFLCSHFLPIAILLTLQFTTSSSFCPQYCGCNDTSLSVQCHSSSNLRVVPIFLNPQIKSLSLSHNQIKDITLSLQFYQELVHLDVSANQLSSLGKGNFESLRALESLNVSYNQVKALESGVFQGLGSLTRLDISGNQVERLERDIFWSLRNVQEIILDRNRLEFIDWELFRGLDKLVRISAQYNFIQVIEPSPSQIPVSSFTTPVTKPRPPAWSLKTLQILDVSSNQLTRVKDDSLSVFTSLKELNLCCNYIHTLEDRAFSSLPALERVNLSQNRLGRVPSSPLEVVGPSLRSLDLSSNRLFNSIPATAFSSLHALQFLRLSDNPGLTSLHPDSLSEQMSLISLEADYLPNLTEFSATLLANKPSLKRFSLRYAHVSVVPSELLEDLSDPAARALDLTGNPIDCNCSAYQLFQYLQHYAQENQDGEENADFHFSEPNFLQHNQLLPPSNNHSHQPYVDQSARKTTGGKQRSPFYLSMIRCASPAFVAGILVKDLKESDFSECFTTQDHFQVLVIILAASILTLIFLVLGVKLCCFSGNSSCGLDKWCNRKEKKSCGCSWFLPCKERRKSETGVHTTIDKEISFCRQTCQCFGSGDKELDKRDRLFDGFRGKTTAEMMQNGGMILPQSQQQIGNNHFIGVQSPSGKLFFSADNSTSSHQLHTQPNSYTYTPINTHPTFTQEDGHYHPHPLHELRHHTLRHYKSNQPLPPLPPYNHNQNFTLFNAKLTKSFHNNLDGRNEYTSPLELNLQSQHQVRPHYDYEEDDDDDENNGDETMDHHHSYSHRTPQKKYNNGIPYRTESNKNRKSNKHNTTRENGHFGGSSSSFQRDRDRQVPNVLV